MAEDVGASQECEEFAFAIQMLQQEIPELEKLVQALRSLLKRLQSRPNPDQAQIQQVTADLQSRNEQLEGAQGQLAAFQAVFDENCRPHP
jgi:peptidoglycan hydrolase CwlO-like protein